MVFIEQILQFDPVALSFGFSLLYFFLLKIVGYEKRISQELKLHGKIRNRFYLPVCFIWGFIALLFLKPKEFFFESDFAMYLDCQDFLLALLFGLLVTQVIFNRIIQNKWKDKNKNY